jgi:hypothetical protein
VDKTNDLSNNGELNFEQQKYEAIALCQRRPDAAVHLYGDGRIDREEYLRRVEENEREIAHWQSITTQIEQAELELAACMEALDTLVRLWDRSNNQDRREMA